MKLLVLLSFALVALVALWDGGAANSEALTQTAGCDRFPTQEAAQAFLSDQLEDTENLDADGDGIACEELPCPCRYEPIERFVQQPAPPAQEPEESTDGPSGNGGDDNDGDEEENPIVVVPQEVYNLLARAYYEGRDPGRIYRTMEQAGVLLPGAPGGFPPAYAPQQLPPGSFVPPSTGDGGLR